MSRLASRRALLSGIAAVPALSLPVLATAPHPDADLLALCRKFPAAASECRAAQAAYSALADREEPNRPPRPDALRRAGDFQHFCFPANNSLSPIFYQRSEALAFKGFEPLAGTLCPRAREEATARAAEIVAAQEWWDEECRRFEEVTGVAEAARRVDAALDCRHEISFAAMDLPATTMEGLLAKSRVGAVLGWPGFDRSILNDLLALGATA